MSDRGELIRQAFAAYADGDMAALKRLFAPDAVWVGIPRGDVVTCPDRSAIVDLLRRHRENGRRFELGDVIEEGDRVAVAFTVLDPAWSGPVEMYKVFTFAARAGVVVRMNDCVDESYARQVLAA